MSSSFTLLRVLVTLVAFSIVVLTEADARPVPSASPHVVARSASTALLSTTRTPPLPALVLARELRRAGNYQAKPPTSFSKTKKLNNSKVKDRKVLSKEMERRDDVHSHIHEHIHGHYDDHDHDYYYDYRHRPDWYTQEEMDHHSAHWAEHHGLLHEDHDHDHEHLHEHIHEHKRDKVTERGLIGDLVKPLLAPLSIIPGFVTISNLLFGDGATDGLLKKLGGLVLHVETANATLPKQAYNFTLLASKHERTQVYLAPVNQSFFAQTSLQGMEADQSDDMVVKVTLPLLNGTGAPVLMCASYAFAPPSALNLEACRDETMSNDDGTEETSQLFTYTPSTGALSPMFLSKGNGSTTASNLTTATRTLSTVPADDDDHDEAAATTPTDAASPVPSSSIDGMDAQTKTLMQFVPAMLDSYNGTAMNTTSSAETPRMIGARRNYVPTAIRLARQRDSGAADDLGAGDDAGTLPDDEPSPSAAGNDKGLVDDLDGSLSSDTFDGEDDAPSRIFLAQVQGETDGDRAAPDGASGDADELAWAATTATAQNGPSRSSSTLSTSPTITRACSCPACQSLSPPSSSSS